MGVDACSLGAVRSSSELESGWIGGRDGDTSREGGPVLGADDMSALCAFRLLAMEFVMKKFSHPLSM
jgi:hypothetical protein